jgi:hypothetical protein
MKTTEENTKKKHEVSSVRFLPSRAGKRIKNICTLLGVFLVTTLAFLILVPEQILTTIIEKVKEWF